MTDDVSDVITTSSASPRYAAPRRAGWGAELGARYAGRGPYYASRMPAGCSKKGAVLSDVLRLSEENRPSAEPGGAGPGRGR